MKLGMIQKIRLGTSSSASWSLTSALAGVCAAPVVAFGSGLPGFSCPQAHQPDIASDTTAIHSRNLVKRRAIFLPAHSSQNLPLRARILPSHDLNGSQHNSPSLSRTLFPGNNPES